MSALSPTAVLADVGEVFLLSVHMEMPAYQSHVLFPPGDTSLMSALSPTAVPVGEVFLLSVVQRGFVG